MKEINFIDSPTGCVSAFENSLFPSCLQTYKVRQVEFFNRRIEYANKNALLLIKFKVLLFS